MRLKRLTSLFILIIAIMSVFAITTIGANAASIPSVPQNFSADIGSESVTLSWDSVSGADGYKIAVLNESDEWATLTWTSGTSVTVAVDSVTTYTLSIRSYDKSSGTTIHSDYADALTITTNPAQVTDLEYTTVSMESISLSWSAVEGATGYQVYVMNTSTSTSYSWYGSTTELSYLMEELTVGDTYNIKVRAYYRPTTGSVTYGSYADTILEVQAGLAQTKNVKINIIAQEDVTITWDTVEYATGYQIWVKEAGDSSFTRLTSTTETSIDLSFDATTQIKVRAYYRAEDSSLTYGAYSAESVVVGMVSNFKVSTSSTGTTFTWDAVEGADGYKVSYLDASGNWSTLTYTTGTTASVSFSSHDVYTVSIRAYEKSTTSSTVHSDYSDTITFLSGLDQTKNVKINIVADEDVTITWNAVENATGYQIWVKEAGDSSFTRLTSTTETSIDLSFDATTQIKVRAYYRSTDSTLTYGDYSTESVVVGMVSNFKVSTSSTSATFTWDAVEGADGYKISYLDASGNWSTLTYTTGETSTTATVAFSSLTTNTVSIRAYEKSTTSSTVHSDYSNTLTFLSGLGQVTNLKSSDLEFKSVSLSWAKVDGATGYQIYGMKTNSATSYSWYGSTTDLSFVVENLTGNNNYKFKVRAYFKSEDGTITYGDYADTIIEIKTTLSQVQDVSITSTSDSTATVSWSEVQAATGYQVYIKAKGSSSFTYYSSTTGTSMSVDFSNVAEVKVRAYYRLVSGSVVYGDYSDVSLYVGTVSDLKVDIGSTSVTFTWSAVSGADGYKISYLTSSGSWSTLTFTSGTSVTVSLDTFTTYTVSIRAYEKSTTSSTVHSDYSDTLTFTTSPAQVKNLTASDIQLNSVELSWSAVTGATGYQVYSEVNGTYKWFDSTTSTSIVCEGLTAYTDYKFKVRAYYRDSTGAVIYGEYASTIIEVTTAVSTTTGLSIVDSSDSSEGATKTVSWSAVAGATGYQIWVKGADSSSYVLYASTSKTSATVDFKAYQNSTVLIKVRAYFTTDDDTLYGSFSSSASVAMGINTVKDFEATDIENNSVTFSWTQSGNCEGYEIQYKLTTASTWARKTISAGTTTSGTVTGLTMGTTYDFSIRAYFTNSSGTKVYSDEIYLVITTTAVTTDVTVDETDVTIFTTDTYQVTATLAPSGLGAGIELVPQSYEYTYGGSWLLGIGSTTVTIDWKDYFSVDANGVITPIKATTIPYYYDKDGDLDNEDEAGTYFSFEIMVKATDSDAYDTITITIKENPLVITSSATTWYKGMTTKLYAVVYDDNYTVTSVVWTSSDTSIATIDSSGNVVFVGTGYVEFTVVTSDGVHSNKIGGYVNS